MLGKVAEIFNQNFKSETNNTTTQTSNINAEDKETTTRSEQQTDDLSLEALQRQNLWLRQQILASDRKPWLK